MDENFSDTAADKIFSLLLTDLPDLLQGKRDEFRMFFRSLSSRSCANAYLEAAKFRNFLLRSDDFVGGLVVSMSDVFDKLKEFLDGEEQACKESEDELSRILDAAFESDSAALSHAYGDRNHISQSPNFFGIGSSSGTQSDVQGSQASHDAMATATFPSVDALHAYGYRSRTPSYVLRSSAEPQSGNFGYDPSTINMGARETISNETSTHRNFEAGTQHHIRRTLRDQHNIHLDGANTQYHFMSVPVPATMDENSRDAIADRYRDFLLRSGNFLVGPVVSTSDVLRKLKELLDAEGTAVNEIIDQLYREYADALSHEYGDRNHISQSPNFFGIGSSSGTQSHFQRSQASHDAMATATFPRVDAPNAYGYRSRTPSYVLRSSADPQSGNFRYGPSTMSMGARETISNETSTHRNFEAGTQHHTRRTLPDQHNIHLDGANTQYHFMSVPVPDTALEHDSISIDMIPIYAASAHSHSQRPLASLSNPPGHDGTIIIQADAEFTSGHPTIHAEARAARDDETAGLSKLIKTLVPVNLTNADKAAKILMSTYHSALPLPIKTFGSLNVGCAGAAVVSSLAGLSLSTFRPNTLPFGCNPQVMIRLMHNVVVHTTAYAFIGTMCHQFLQDDPSIMWIVAGLASAAFMTTMTFIGWRR